MKTQSKFKHNLKSVGYTIEMYIDFVFKKTGIKLVRSTVANWSRGRSDPPAESEFVFEAIRRKKMAEYYKTIKLN